MRILIFTFIILCINTTISAQKLTEGNIYALIIGISEYEDGQIKDLEFAHRDAQIFADYLMSEAGGLVPKTNIKLLTNKQATISNIYLAKQWLEDKAQKGDLVFFYFSGHGDVESSLYKLGFLLAHDTPHKNYLNNAVRIEDFNIMANTLSIKKEAKVVLITDACHSGKLAGSDNRGKALVGDQLSTVSNNEIRIASCESKQLSQEDKTWGGGRGVFSYYLINGLKGLADQGGDDSDGIVTLKELKEYLEEKVFDDVKKLKQEEQDPVVQGKNRTLMAIVNDDVLEALQNESTSLSVAGTGGSKSVNALATPADIYFQALSNVQFDQTISIEAWSNISATKIVDVVLQKYPFEYLSDSLEDKSEYLTWKNQIPTDVTIKKDFEYRLAGMFHDKIQKAINAYLVGDKEELRRRQYYDANPEEFDQYAVMLEKATQLIDNSNYLHSIMKAKSHYFKGIASRIRMNIIPNRDSLLNHAFEQQQKALSIDDKAAYIHNELGILYKAKNDFINSEKEFIIAIELVPKWALPVSNLSNLYYKQAKYKEGLELGQKAVLIQPDYRAGYVQLGQNAKQLNNYLLAEESFIQSTRIDDRHFSGFENLGHLYTITTDYEKADFNFYEAAIRLEGFEIDALDDDGDGVIDLWDSDLDAIMVVPCEINISKLGKNDNMAYLVVGIDFFKAKDYTNAVKYIEKSLEINEYSPVAYMYLGKIAWMNKEWTRAEYLLNIAKEKYLDYEEFLIYADELSKNQKYLNCDMIGRYKNLHYNDVDNYYLLGNLYTNINNYEKAEQEYKTLIDLNTSHLLNYKLLWELYELQSQYADAESVIHQYGKHGDFRLFINELFAFYMRLANDDINSVTNTYKAANLLYNNINLTRNYSSDNIIAELYDSPPNHEDVLFVPGTDVPNKFAESNLQYNIKATELYESIVSNLPLIKEAEVLNKLGNLYWHDGDIELSKSHFKDALAIANQNSSIKEKLIELHLFDNELIYSFSLLESLYDNHQINALDLITYSKFVAHIGQYVKSDQVTAFANTVFPLYNETIAIHKAKRSLFSNDTKKAINQYSDLIDKNVNVSDNYYTLTRIYAESGNKRKALSSLKKAIKSGFTYNWVLDKDPKIANLKQEKKYLKLRNKLPESNI